MAELTAILNITRSNLLDQTLRNRLLKTLRSSARSKRLDIVNEKSDEIYRILVREIKAMTFLPNQREGGEPPKQQALVHTDFEAPKGEAEKLEHWTDTRHRGKTVRSMDPAKKVARENNDAK